MTKSQSIFEYQYLNKNRCNSIIQAFPWEVTTSYYAGTSAGPSAIQAASYQLDLYHPLFELQTEQIAFQPAHENIITKNTKLCAMSHPIIHSLNNEKPITDTQSKEINMINNETQALFNEQQDELKNSLRQNKQTILLGGEHAISLPYLSAIDTPFGILQIDAHMDLREAYQGFTHSHASVMFNAVALPNVTQLTQVGVRDCAREEVSFATAHPKIQSFFCRNIHQKIFQGQQWARQVKEIIDTLPQAVYITLDIDALEQHYCPNTGTPVPGGLSFDMVTYLIEQLFLSERKIVGADIVEVAPGEKREWDANVAARLLFLLCGLMQSQD